MRRVRYLHQVDFVATVGQKTSQVLTLSPSRNSLIERTWHKVFYKQYGLLLNAKFNSSLMNGISISARLELDNKTKSCEISSFVIKRVSDSDWSETLVHSETPTMSPDGSFTAYVQQSDLGSNELSGAETYSITCTALRRRKTFNKTIWINHLGVFDSLNRVKEYAFYLESTKVDE